MIFFHIHFKIFLFLLIYNEIKEINCSRRPTPWFIFEEHLYYVDTNQNVSNYKKLQTKKKEKKKNILWFFAYCFLFSFQ